MHDTFHGYLHSNEKTNDSITRWTLAYPIGSLYDISKQKHLQHHRDLGKSDDPDYPLYKSDNKKTKTDF